MKIGYFGDGIWAHEALKKIIQDQTLEIVFVVLRYDSQDVVLRELAEERHIPVLVHPNINSHDFKYIVEKYEADLFVSMSFNQIFGSELLNYPPLKTINCHAGKLPFYRGRNILNWVLINDETEFGITVHYMDVGIDTGDIILQRTFPISDQDDYRTLLEKAHVECGKILFDAIKQIENGTVHVIKQKDIDEIGIYCGVRKPGDEIINWSQNSRRIFNFVRAITTPGPCATTFIHSQEVKIIKVELVQGARKYINTPGQIVGRDGDNLIVKTGDTIIKIVDYECNATLHIGDRLG